LLAVALATTALLTVAALVPAGESATATTRTYYVAADEVAWDYAPSGTNQVTGEPFGAEENVFVGNGPNRVGST
jgi:hephaestin